MIKNIVFDMGQVLIKFDPDFFLEKVNIKDPEDKKLLKREVYQSVEWAEMDRGSLTEKQAEQIMCKRLPERLHMAVKALTSEWCRPIIPIEGMAELVKELKDKNYGIYLLSNASDGQKEYWSYIPGSKYFDGRMVSCEEMLVKPQPEIFLLLLNRFGLKAHECVFIDDSPQNCEAALYCGLNPIVFHGDAEELRAKLKAEGVNI